MSKLLLESIPTEDPTRALTFCRALQEALSQSQNGSVAGVVTERPTLSVVVPIFNEEDNITTLYERLSETLLALSLSFEIIFVDDGSADRSAELLEELAKKQEHVTVVTLSRNFGQQLAFSAGLDFTRGEAVVVMDADLQDPPEVIPQFIEKWRAGHDVVYAVREKRKERFLKRAAYSLFYRVLRAISHVQMPVDAGDFCLMDRRVVDILVSMPERSRFIRGIRSWIGLRQTGLLVERESRHAGVPSYTVQRLFELGIDGLISFSYKPLRIISILGVVVSLLSMLLAVFYTIVKFTFGLQPEGFATIVVMISFFAGIQLITIGLIGEYVGRIFEEVKKRPLYIIKSVVSKRFQSDR